MDDFIVDHYGRAQQIAKSYCKKHPDANREIVYYAASEAAEQYERSSELRTHDFKNIVNLRIVHHLHKKGKEMTVEIKKAIIADANAGMTAKEIAEKYNLNYGTTVNNIIAWRKKGFITYEDTDKKEPAPKTAQADENGIAKTSIMYHHQLRLSIRYRPNRQHRPRRILYHLRLPIQRKRRKRQKLIW